MDGIENFGNCSSLNSPTNIREDSREMVSIKQFAQRFSWSEITVRRRIKDGTLPAIQLGGTNKSWRIPVDKNGIFPASQAHGSSPLATAGSMKPKPQELPKAVQSRQPRWLKKPI